MHPQWLKRRMIGMTGAITFTGGVMLILTFFGVDGTSGRGDVYALLVGIILLIVGSLFLRRWFKAF